MADGAPPTEMLRNKACLTPLASCAMAAGPLLRPTYIYVGAMKEALG